MAILNKLKLLGINEIVKDLSFRLSFGADYMLAADAGITIALRIANEGKA